MTTSPQKITFGEMRESGVRDVLIYCRDHRCSHHIETSALDSAGECHIFSGHRHSLIYGPSMTSSARKSS
jgi:hypothetical protein